MRKIKHLEEVVVISTYISLYKGWIKSKLLYPVFREARVSKIICEKMKHFGGMDSHKGTII